MKTVLALLVLCAVSSEVAGQTSELHGQAEAVRAELERLYALNTKGFLSHDVPAIMALRAPEFHTVTPDGTRRDRGAVEHYITGLLNGIRKWNRIDFTIDSLTVRNDTAYAIVSQHLDREALRPDNKVHHVETWVVQRETWVRIHGKWLMWRVDDLRDQRRRIDGHAE